MVVPDHRIFRHFLFQLSSIESGSVLRSLDEEMKQENVSKDAEIKSPVEEKPDETTTPIQTVEVDEAPSAVPAPVSPQPQSVESGTKEDDAASKTSKQSKAKQKKKKEPPKPAGMHVYLYDCIISPLNAYLTHACVYMVESLQHHHQRQLLCF